MSDSNQPLPNPYAHELPVENIELSPSVAKYLSCAFLLLIGLPPLWHDLSQWQLPKEQRWLPAVEFVKTVSDTTNTRSLAERLRAFEAQLPEHLGFAQKARQTAQLALLQGFAQGNDRVVLGESPWLFYRPELSVLTGLGPLRAAPVSVAEAPAAVAWQPPMPVIEKFAKDLHARGMELWLVPVPMKESIYPESLTRQPSARPVLHPDEALLSKACEQAGVRYVALADFLWQMKAEDGSKGPVYLHHDTHWSPRAMQAVAAHLAEQLRLAGVQGAASALPLPPSRQAEGMGDLVEKLGLPAGAANFQPEVLTLQPLPAWGQDAASSIVLLGDSFVNVFHDPSLGWGDGAAADGPAFAGLAQHLGVALGKRLDVIAINGGGATTVRQQFANRPAQALAGKRVVLWVMAARDLFMSRMDAMAHQVSWAVVPFREETEARAQVIAEPSGQGALVTAKVVQVSKFPPNAKTTPYPNAVVSVRYRIDVGSRVGEEIVVMHWLYRNREPQPAARLRVGELRDLRLQPWAEDLPAYTVTLLDDFAELDCFYSELPPQ